MDALFLVWLYLNLTEVRSLPSPQPKLVSAKTVLSQTYTPPNRGIPDRRLGAGTR